MSATRRVAHSRGFAALVAVILLALVGPVVVSGAASAQDPAAVRAAEEIQAARDRANAAAQATFDAESRLDTLDVEIAEAEKQLAAVEAAGRIDASSLQADALRSFANSGHAPFHCWSISTRPTPVSPPQRQASVARGAASVEHDDFDVVMKEVKAQRADLERQKEVTAQAREQLRAAQDRPPKPRSSSSGRSRSSASPTSPCNANSNANDRSVPSRTPQPPRRRTALPQPGCRRSRRRSHPDPRQDRRGSILERQRRNGASAATGTGTGTRDTATVERRQRHRVSGRRATSLRRHLGRSPLGRPQPRGRRHDVTGGHTPGRRRVRFGAVQDDPSRRATRSGSTAPAAPATSTPT